MQVKILKDHVGYPDGFTATKYTAGDIVDVTDGHGATLLASGIAEEPKAAPVEQPKAPAKK